MEEDVKILKLFKAYKIDSTPRYSNQFTNTMASLGSLIPPNPHQHIQYVEFVTIKDSSLNSPLSSPLSKASIDEIQLSLKTCDRSNFMSTSSGMVYLHICHLMRSMLSRIMLLST